MNLTINWKGNMTFAGESPSGHLVTMDSNPKVSGTNNGPRPMELIAIGLASCTAMDAISILKKKRQDVTRFDITFDAPRAHDFPKVFTSAVIKYVFSGKKLSEDAVRRAIELSTGKYCPAYAMLTKAFPIELHYEIYEDEEDGNQTMTHQGVWEKPEQD